MKTNTVIQICFSAFVLTLSIWAFYEYKQSQTEKGQKSSILLSSLELEELKAFRIIRKNTLSITRKDQDWFLEKPVKDLASFSEISRWFGELKNIKVEKVKTDVAIDWKTYQLDKAPSVEIDFSSGEKIIFSVSPKKTFDDKYFIKKGEELFVGESYFYNEVNKKDFNDFRSKKLLPPLGHATEIKLQGQENLTLKWDNYKWFLLKPAQSFPLNSSRLDGFWTDINGLYATHIKEAVSPRSLQKYKLDKAKTQISFKYPGEKQKYILKISPFQNKKAFVSVSHRDFIFEITEEEGEKLIISPKEIRDHQFPFNYNQLKANHIERKNKVKSFSIKKVKEEWTTFNDNNKIVESKKVEQLLEKIKQLEGKKYQFDNIEHNLRSIEIKDSNGQQIFEIKEVLRSEDYSWVKTNLWDELVALSKNSLNEIFDINIFKNPKKLPTKK